ncbi:DUF3558 domain-containing protein [Amycolatopsis sp. NPDC059027]|uniref:DUF3558 domain-containing protein n=1 Tax=unclassified Amycolatopsis TaxID=2618356 RepID=UPI00367038AD
MRTFRALSVLTVVGGLAAVTVACSSPAPAPHRPPSSAPAASKAAELKDPCTLLSAEEVGKAISKQGVTTKAGQVENAANGGKSRACQYLVEGKPAGELKVTQYASKAKPSEMIAGIKKDKVGAQDVSGFSDGAVYYTEGQKTAFLVAGKVSNGVPTLIDYAGPTKMTAEMMAPLVKTALAAN